jgi:erythromycin esterase-like protein
MSLRVALPPLAALPLALLGCATAPAATAGGAGAAAGDSAVVAAVREAAVPLTGSREDYDPLIEMIGDARVVLLGEATHGTHEFYRERARITRRLIEEHGFTALAVEGDWPEAYRVNRYVRGEGASASEALAGFERFPGWMWRNTDVVELVDWMRARNAALPSDSPRVAIYGLDLQTLGPALDAVTDYLATADPAAAGRARERYRCFEPFGDDPVAYAQSVEYGAVPSCERQVAEQLREFEGPLVSLGRGGAPGARDDYFAAAQSARLVVGSEAYFRAMFRPGVSTWNMRDRYMQATLEGLLRHLDTPERPARVVVWAHNSHVGDARAVHMGDQGELNLGQLTRQRWGTDVVLVGFSTHTGTVIAASDWGAAPARKTVRPALPGSYPDLFHRTGLDAFLLVIRDAPVREALRQPRLDRAIGVIYLPQTERVSHYSHARMAEQFDALIYLDETRAVDPLESQLGGGVPAAPPNATRG